MTTQNFTDLGLSKPILRAFTDLGYETPTPVQLAAIPAALAGADIIATAKTGTGKTAAFAAPILQRLEIGRGRIVREGTKIALLSFGARLAECLKAAEELTFTIRPPRWAVRHRGTASRQVKYPARE